MNDTFIWLLWALIFVASPIHTLGQQYVRPQYNALHIAAHIQFSIAFAVLIADLFQPLLNNPLPELWLDVAYMFWSSWAILMSPIVAAIYVWAAYNALRTETDDKIMLVKILRAATASLIALVALIKLWPATNFALLGEAIWYFNEIDRRARMGLAIFAAVVVLSILIGVTKHINLDEPPEDDKPLTFGRKQP